MSLAVKYLSPQFVLLLFLLFCCGYVFCDEPEKTQAVYTIYFGEIEPPVVAQKDITVRAPVSNQSTENKPLECSGLAWTEGNLLISSDRHQHLVFTCPLDLDTMTLGVPKPSVVVQNEQYLLDDVESITVRKTQGQTALYMMCSMSNAPDGQPLPQRRHFLGCHFNQTSGFEIEHCNVTPAGTIRQQLEVCFEKIKAEPYYAYNADSPGMDINTYRWGNVEGITFTPEGQLLCGMRNPLFDNSAIVFAVAGIPEISLSMSKDLFKVTDFFLLDLGQRGVSEISWDPVTEGYLITAAKSNGPRLDPDQPYPPNTLDSALFWWSGNKNDAPILVALIPDMTIEAVCRLGNSRYIALGSDEGDVSEGRTARQSIITIMEFTGIRSKSE